MLPGSATENFSTFPDAATEGSDNKLILLPSSEFSHFDTVRTIVKKIQIKSRDSV